jgi:hypothetical protein
MDGHSLHRFAFLGLLLSAACAFADDGARDDEDAWRLGEGDDGGVIIVPPGDAGSGTPIGDDDGGGGRGGGDWIINGLAEPSVSGVDPAYPLDSAHGLGQEGWLAENDPAGEKVIRYLVECALDHGQIVTVEGPTTTYQFEGWLGLATEWRTDPCDQECQEWVSACLLARTNETETETLLFVQGEHPQLGFGFDPSLPLYEGTFFGNVFTDPPVMYACRGDSGGTAAAALWGRTCTQDVEECGFSTYADCDVEAGCQYGEGSVPTIDCQPGGSGPIYSGISVHLAAP